ncbi:MAG TPA: TraB/GumN family protein, partial [Ferruginibacter sp.]|nr:TraB/GumN family protein [Ferruginibacter sp.]
MQLYDVANSHVYSMMCYKRILPFLFLLPFTCLQAQLLPASKKYQGLLWEITGNGMTKPSYVFGTMHVSNKLAFHLSDSFYYALKQVDAVALELNPDLWQAQMVRLARLNDNYTEFIQSAGNDYITENSFRINNYENTLKAALSTEPPVVNSLLYRSYKTRDDFEEDTFLDLYIFQAGRKLGKSAAGVEDYYESEKLVMEAYRDMANEKKKKEVDLDGESMGSILQKIQQAYRYGDLDLMDSLDNLMEKSPAFREKFLYKRNEIQADAIDSIIKNKALFAGVGAAHLPGDRGVIELLRKKGYRLRAVKMTDRDGEQKDAINKLKVPVSFTTQQSDDHFYRVDVPGPLYALKNSYQELDRTQYADMSNGAYYLVTRFKTYASFIPQLAAVNKKVDSVLYEYIPGTILSKKIISNNGYPGYDISNRTRRGDLQRYHIYITPFEVIIFKMSGKGDYVNGEEAQRFFGSIQLKEKVLSPAPFMPEQGGFTVRLPHEPHSYFNEMNDGRWEYEAVDKTTGEAYLLFKKSVYNYNFLEADSFDLALIETSFRSSEYFEKQLSRKYTTINGYPALLVKEKLKDGNFVHA